MRIFGEKRDTFVEQHTEKELREVVLLSHVFQKVDVRVKQHIFDRLTLKGQQLVPQHQIRLDVLRHQVIDETREV